MGNKLFVGGLAWGTDEDSLRQAFESFGSVREAKVIMDRETGRSRGFGFVTFDAEADAMAAIKGMDGSSLDGRNIRVNEAEDKRGGAGGGGGGFRSQAPRPEPQIESRRGFGGGYGGDRDVGGDRTPRRGGGGGGGRGNGRDW